MRRLSVILLAIILVASFAKSQDSTAKQNDLSQRVQRLMDIHVGFEQMIPSGTSIEAKEISRTGRSGSDLIVKYHILLKGIPADTLFQYIDWPVNAEKATARLGGISLGKNGILMCAGREPEQCGDPKKPDDPIDFILMPRKGEPTRLAFISKDVKIGTVIVPDPIRADDKGCTLSAVRLTPKFELAFLSGSGYPPNTDLHYRVSSEMTSDFVIKSDSNGTIRVSVIPYPGKKAKGKVSVKVTESMCFPELSYAWGTI
jgi:hypothetical protein